MEAVNACMNPSRYLDNDCIMCYYAFRCPYTLENKGVRHKEPVEIIMEPPTTVIDAMCDHCKKPSWVQVTHRTTWNVCNACLISYFPNYNSQQIESAVHSYGYAGFSLTKRKKNVNPSEIPDIKDNTEAKQQMYLF